MLILKINLMKYLLLFLFISFSTHFSFSQIIDGIVLDIKTNKPIEKVHVYINNLQQGTLTNGRGKFSIKLSSALSNIDTIFFSHIGYKKQAFPFSKNKKKYLIYLTINSNELSEITLVGDKKLNSSLHFNKLTSMKNGLSSFGSVLINDKIYVIGGDASYEIDYFRKAMDWNSDLTFAETFANGGYYSNQIYKGDLLVYNIASDIWETDELKFRKRAFHNLNLLDNKIYVLGGKRYSRNRKFEYLDDKIEVLDLEDKIIKVDNTNPHQAVNFISFSYEGNLILMGGSIKKKKNGLKLFSNKVHLYHIKSGLWYELASMPSAKETKGVLINNKIYTFGGFNNSPLKDIESFDLITGKWQKEGELFSPLTQPAITHINDMVYLFENGKMVTYNINSKELKEYAIDLFLNASELQYAEGKLYIFGGFKNKEYSILRSRGLFRVNLSEFEATKVIKTYKI